MTTIAYKDGVIAYDGLVCSGDIITSHDHDKKLRVDKITFVYAGVIGDLDKTIHAYLTGEKEVDAEIEMLVLNEGQVSVVGVDQGRLFEDSLAWADVYALGSGRTYALAAMDAGVSAKEAVKIAAGRDVYTGGKIRTLRVK